MDHRNGSKPMARIRILSLGNPGVGKSCLIKRYCEKRFVNKYVPTVGIDYGSSAVDVDGRKVSVHFFDTSGSPLFEEVRTEFYRDMQGILLIYDVTDRSSFIALDAWLAELRHNLGPVEEWSAVVVVCGTRTDTAGTGGRQVTEADGKGWADKHKFPHVLTSAALGNGIHQAFHTLLVAALQLKGGVRGAAGGGGVDVEVVQAIHRLTHLHDDFDKMGLARRSTSKEEVNKSYRRLAALVHPDKCKASGAEEAFKALTQARNNLLKILTETTV
ncbi:DnaJ subfamily C member 27 [Chionoecetes opilio]|uniref:DnaJ subfamily C member 27 n=1 Tax=Chionoecetes opilio TaxID=41210 RepID=A0A8J4XL18_CHIOP|nr:DnaJ subfamily C member 27 [Chionoecetes opilio]